MRNAPIAVIKGGFAHELGHIIVDKTERWIDRIAWALFKQYQILDERNADLIAIMRGYGHELLAMVEYSESKGNGYSKDCGLSRIEIKQILSCQK